MNPMAVLEVLCFITLCLNIVFIFIFSLQVFCIRIMVSQHCVWNFCMCEYLWLGIYVCFLCVPPPFPHLWLFFFYLLVSPYSGWFLFILFISLLFFRCLFVFYWDINIYICMYVHMVWIWWIGSWSRGNHNQAILYENIYFQFKKTTCVPSNIISYEWEWRARSVVHWQSTCQACPGF